MTPIAPSVSIAMLTIASLVVLFALAMREIGSAYRRRERLLCPVRLRRVRVLFGSGPTEGPPT
jgi:cytochrome bd-type quinol oxidase subunit 2